MTYVFGRRGRDRALKPPSLAVEGVLGKTGATHGSLLRVSLQQGGETGETRVDLVGDVGDVVLTQSLAALDAEAGAAGASAR